MSEKFARAIENGNVEKVISLIGKSTVSVNSRLPRYFNPSALQHAAFYKQAAIVQILLQNGACIDDVNDQGMTACHVATHFTPGIDNKTDMVDTVRQLLSYQPNLSLKDVAGRTSLQYSFESENNEDISMMLLKAGAPHAGLPEQYLCYFASTGTEAIQILHERGVVIRDLRCDEFNETALHLCIRDKRGDAVAKMLVDVGGIDIEARDVRRNSCLQFASIYGNFDALSWLIGAGADVNCTNLFGTSALHFARTYDDAILLLAGGALAHEKDLDGRTPIFFHARSDRYPLSIIHALLSAGADLDTADSKGESARDWLAYRRVNYVNVDAVLQAGKDIAKARLDFVRHRAIQVCNGLQSLQLPALQTCEILLFATGPIAPLVPFHQWWKIATVVKHFSVGRTN